MIRKPVPKPPKKNLSLDLVKQALNRVPRRYFWQGKFGPAFWTIASILSLTVNLILLLVLIILGRQLFNLKTLIQEGLIGGLHENFVLMDQASIKTTIQVQETIKVEDEIPVVFNLPLKQKTVVTLVDDTSIPETIVYLNGVPIRTTVVLPEGTPLHISLNLTVPVDTMVPVVLDVPVNISVPVDIALDQTELHAPFLGLQQVVAPYQELLTSLPSSWDETPICSPLFMWFCRMIFGLP